MHDFSSMSDEEKKGYLKALGIDPREMVSTPTENGGKDDFVSVSMDRAGLSDEELSLLQKKRSARVRGALSTAFATVLKASFASLEVGKEVTVKIKPHAGSERLNRLRVREAIEAGLKPLL